MMKRKTESYKERTVMKYFLKKIQKQKIYSTLEAGKLQFDGKKKMYVATHLVHNSDITNLSFSCKAHPPEINEYNISTLNFDNKESREKMIKFLEKIKNSNIEFLKKYEELIIKTAEDNRHKILLVDRNTNSINLYSLISTVNSYASFSIKDYFKDRSFQYKVITSVWQTVKKLRSLGYKNMGINSKLIYMTQRNSVAGLKDIKTRFLDFCQSPLIRIEYKFNQFRKLLLADARKEISLQELINLKYVSKELSEKFQNKGDIIKDHNSFIVFVLEVSLMTHHIEFLDQIDFQRGVLSKRLEAQINDPVIIDMIYFAFDDRFRTESIFFSDENLDFIILEKFKRVKGIQDLNFRNLSPDLLIRGVKIVPRAKCLTFFLRLKDKNLSFENLKLIATNCVNKTLISDVVKLIKNNLINFSSHVLVLRCLIYFLVVFFEESLIKDVVKMDNRDYKKFLVHCLYFYSEVYDEYSDIEVENLAKVVCYSIKCLSNGLFGALKKANPDFLDYLMEISLDFKPPFLSHFHM